MVAVSTTTREHGLATSVATVRYVLQEHICVSLEEKVQLVSLPWWCRRADIKTLGATVPTPVHSVPQDNINQARALFPVATVQGVNTRIPQVKMPVKTVTPGSIKLRSVKAAVNDVKRDNILLAEEHHAETVQVWELCKQLYVKQRNNKLTQSILQLVKQADGDRLLATSVQVDNIALREPVAEIVGPEVTAHQDGRPAVHVPKVFFQMGVQTPDAKVALRVPIKTILDRTTVKSHQEDITKWTVRTLDNVQSADTVLVWDLIERANVLCAQLATIAVLQRFPLRVESVKLVVMVVQGKPQKSAVMIALLGNIVLKELLKEMRRPVEAQTSIARKEALSQKMLRVDTIRYLRALRLPTERIKKSVPKATTVSMERGINATNAIMVLKKALLNLLVVVVAKMASGVPLEARPLGRRHAQTMTLPSIA